MFKTKIKKLFIALYLLIGICYAIFYTPVNDVVIEGSYRNVSSAKYIVTSGHYPIYYTGLSGSRNHQSGREIDYHKLALELGLIGAGTMALYFIASMFVKDANNAN